MGFSSLLVRGKVLFVPTILRAESAAGALPFVNRAVGLKEGERKAPTSAKRAALLARTRARTNFIINFSKEFVRQMAATVAVPVSNCVRYIAKYH